MKKIDFVSAGMFCPKVYPWKKRWIWFLTSKSIENKVLSKKKFFENKSFSLHKYFTYKYDDITVPCYIQTENEKNSKV